MATAPAGAKVHLLFSTVVFKLAFGSLLNMSSLRFVIEACTENV